MTVCYQRREWQHAHFLGKNTTMHILGLWNGKGSSCFSPPMKKPNCQICCLFDDPSAMRKEWANGVSGNLKNFEVKIKSHEKTQARFDGRQGNALIASTNRQTRHSDESICFDEPGIARASRTRGQWWKLARGGASAFRPLLQDPLQIPARTARYLNTTIQTEKCLS